MKALKYGFGLMLVGGFALTASCGGSSDDSSGSAGTTSSTGGTSATGGTFTTGGTSATTGGTSTTGGTGTTTGGTGTTTGGTGTTTGGATAAGGGTAAGGATTNPAGCPAPAATAPKTGDMCTLAMNNRRENCVYPAANPGEAENCRCAAPRGTGAAGAADMPEAVLTCQVGCAAPTSTPPKTGEACTMGLDCTYGSRMEGLDICQCRAQKWNCRTFGGMGAAGAGG